MVRDRGSKGMDGCPLTAAVYAVVITATAVYVASAVSAVLDVAAIFTISTAAVSTDSVRATLLT
jgi:hypothetical protein